MAEPSLEYHLQRYHAHRKWARYHGILFLVGALTIVGIVLSWAFAIRGYQHRKKANEHEAAADRELSPSVAVEREMREDPENPIPCPECDETIDADRGDCPYCKTSRWTSGRRNTYLFLYLPLASMLAGAIFATMLSPGPFVNPLVMVIVIAMLYAGGAAWVWAQYSEELEWIEQHEG